MIGRLAEALGVPPSELTTLPVPAPANGRTDSTTEALRLALDAIEVDRRQRASGPPPAEKAADGDRPEPAGRSTGSGTGK